MEYVLLAFIVLFASTTQSGTGFGFSILSIPFLLILFEAHDAIQLNIFLSLVLSVVVSFQTRKEIDKGIFLRLLTGSLGGLLPGILLFLYLNVRPLALLAGVAILLFTCLLLSKIKITPSKGRERIIGALSGLLTGSIGVPGPPLLIYFAGARVDKAKLRSTTLAYFSFIYFLSLLLQVLFYGVSESLPRLALISLPFLFLGIYLGHLLFSRLHQDLFMKIIYGLLFFSGFYLIISLF